MSVKSLAMSKVRIGCMKVWVSDIVNEYALLEIKVVKTNSVPYMNDQLRKSMNVRNMFRRKYTEYLVLLPMVAGSGCTTGQRSHGRLKAYLPSAVTN